MSEYELIHMMDVSPEAILRSGACFLADLHKDDVGQSGITARKVLELADQIEKDLVRVANGR